MCVATHRSVGPSVLSLKRVKLASSDCSASSRLASSSAYPPTGIIRYGTSSCLNIVASIRAASNPSCDVVCFSSRLDPEHRSSPHPLQRQSLLLLIPILSAVAPARLSSCRRVCKFDLTIAFRALGVSRGAWWISRWGRPDGARFLCSCKYYCKYQIVH